VPIPATLLSGCPISRAHFAREVGILTSFFHPERSTSGSEAIRPAKSKDPLTPTSHSDSSGSPRQPTRHFVSRSVLPSAVMWCGAGVERAPPPAAFDFGFDLILVLPFQTLVLPFLILVLPFLTLNLPRAQSRDPVFVPRKHDTHTPVPLPATLVPFAFKRRPWHQVPEVQLCRGAGLPPGSGRSAPVTGQRSTKRIDYHSLSGRSGMFLGAMSVIEIMRWSAA